MSNPSTAVPVFDADAFATEPLELRIGGAVYRGRILSIVEWMGWKDRLVRHEEIEKAEGDQPKPETAQASLELMLAYMRDVFPPVVKRSGLLRRRVTIDPIAVFERRGARDTRTAFARFFGHQLHAMGFVVQLQTVSRIPQATMVGIDSLAKTTNAPSTTASAPEPT